MKDVSNHLSALSSPMSRRRFVTGVAAGSAALGLGLGTRSAMGAPASRPQAIATLRGNRFNLEIGYLPVNFTGKKRIATAINGSVPAPILRWREGDTVTLNVTNHLAHDSSVHWHGIILPANMDGVPNFSYPGIKPGETFKYQFKVQQNGTFWYHSHSGFQEQTGLYGALVIEPKEPDPFACDRDYVVQLSDWSDTDPDDIYATLKKHSDYYNFQERTVGDLWDDIRKHGIAATWNRREMWNQMRMSQHDISDVTGYTYTFLMNGQTPDQDWTALFKRGEKVRLRFINSSSMTIFDIRIPGLKMKVVSADGQNVDPVSVDQFRIGVAETYDVIVEPDGDSAYTLFAESIDRSGYARGTLTTDPSLRAPVPAMDPPPVLTMRDMGMDMGSMAGMSGMKMDDRSSQKMSSMSGMSNTGTNMNGMQMGDDKKPAMNMSGSSMSGKGMSGMAMAGMQSMGHKPALGKAGFGSNNDIIHAPTEFGPQVDMRAQAPQSGLHDPGIGLRDFQKKYGRKVLTYGDLRNFYPTWDKREPGREIQLHLTGNMARYMWSIDGIKFADAAPLKFNYGERLRIVLVNDTMMTHPIHLHGMWSEVETGDPDHIPRKHTVIVQPGAKISYLVTANAKGDWAYHCHLLYHMLGMMRRVRVS